MFFDEKSIDMLIETNPNTIDKNANMAFIALAVEEISNTKHAVKTEANNIIINILCLLYITLMIFF